MYDPGVYSASAAAMAKRADVAIVFATKFETEGYDSPDLSLPTGQDDLIAAVAGTDVPQLYLTARGHTKLLRLLGFERVNLEPADSRSMQLVVDPRLLARFDIKAARWRIDSGTYEVTLSRSAGAPGDSASVNLEGRLFGR